MKSAANEKSYLCLQRKFESAENRLIKRKTSN